MPVKVKPQNILSRIRSEIELRIEIFNEGMDFDDSALEGVGSEYTEDITGLFGYYKEGWKPGIIYPSCFQMPLGTVSKTVFNRPSPYLARKVDGQLILEKDGKLITTIEWMPRTRMYSMKCSDGTPMKSVGHVLARTGNSFCIDANCSYWDTNDQCAYCNSNAIRVKGEVDAQVLRKEPFQVAEVAAASLASGCQSTLLSCGTRPEDVLVETFVDIMSRIKEITGLTDLCAINMPAPNKLENIDRLKEAGARSVIFDQEVWDANSFKAICPGKAKGVGRDNWMRALEYASKRYTEPEKGINFAMGAIVLGLEEKNKYLEAAEWYADRNIVLHLPPWKVMKGSNFYGARSPHSWWTMEVSEECFNMQMKKMPWVMTRQFWSHTPQHAYTGAQTQLYWDFLRMKLIEEGIIAVDDKMVQDWEPRLDKTRIADYFLSKGIITRKELKADPIEHWADRVRNYTIKA